jgi:GNAT superfamily N-acetyltransferase
MTEHIRVATTVDLANLADLVAAFREHLDHQFIEKVKILRSLEKLLVEDDVEFLIAFTDRKVAVAYTQIRYYYSLWSLGLEAQIEDLFVLPSERGCGLGSSLIQHAIGCARNRGCHLMALNTNEQNVEALSFYRKVGFKAERQGSRQFWLEMPLEAPLNRPSRD